MAAGTVAKDSLLKLASEMVKGTGVGLHTLGNVIKNLESPGAAFQKASAHENVWWNYEVSPETSEFYGDLGTAMMTTPQGQALARGGKAVVGKIAETAQENPQAALQAAGLLAITDIMPGFNKMTAPAKKVVMDFVNDKIDVVDMVTQAGDLLDAQDIIDAGKLKQELFKSPIETDNLKISGDYSSRPTGTSDEYVTPVVHVTPREINPIGLGGGRRGIPYVALQKEFNTPNERDNLNRMIKLGQAAIGETDEFGQHAMTGGNMVNPLKSLRDFQDANRRLSDVMAQKEATISRGNVNEILGFHDAINKARSNVKQRKEFYTEDLKEGHGVTSIPMYARRGILGHVQDEKDRALQVSAIQEALDLPEYLSGKTMDDLTKRSVVSHEANDSIIDLLDWDEVAGVHPYFKDTLPDYLPNTMQMKLNMARNHSIEDLFYAMRDGGDPDITEIAAKNFRPHWDDVETGGAYGRIPFLARYMHDSGFRGMRVEDEMEGLSVAIFDPDSLRHKFYGFGE